MISSHFRRVKREKLHKLLDNAKPFVRYFSVAKTQDLHHYLIKLLLKENLDIVIHIGSNNITHRILDDVNANKLADETINKYSIKLSQIITQVNKTVTKNVK